MEYTGPEGFGREAARMVRALPVYRRVLPGEIRYADNGVAPEEGNGMAPKGEAATRGWMPRRDAIRLEIAHEWRPVSGVTRYAAASATGDPLARYAADDSLPGYAADDPFAGYEEFAAERSDWGRP